MVSEGFLVKYWAVSSRQDVFTLLIFNKNPNYCWRVKVWQAQSLNPFLSLFRMILRIKRFKNWTEGSSQLGWQRPSSSSSSSKMSLCVQHKCLLMNTRLTVVIKQLLHNQNTCRRRQPPHSRLMELTSSSFFSRLQTAAQEFMTVSAERFLRLHVIQRHGATLCA